MTAVVAVAATPEEVFRNPPREAHVGVWWHWMGSQVTEEGIRKDLDWFQRMGVFSATVFGVADSCTPWARRIGNVPTDGLRPFDERWWKLFAFACREGQKRGIDIGLHNCPGYTSTGGPWIPSRLAMRELVFNVTNAAARYFSGTLTYRTRFDLPGAVAKAGLRFSAMADQIVAVRLNGRPAGTAWCEPYLVDLPVEALKEKGNELEIDVTNSWRNRLIGDEQEPTYCAFENAQYGGQFLLRYPDWFKDGIGARPSKGRKCFTTWNYFTKDSKLTPSGLICPPVLTWKEK